MTARHTATTSVFALDGARGTLTVARDDTGRVALVDLRLGRQGSCLGGLADALGSALTLALRAGAPADLLAAHRIGGAPVPPPHPGSPVPALHAALTAAP